MTNEHDNPRRRVSPPAAIRTRSRRGKASGLAGLLTSPKGFPLRLRMGDYSRWVDPPAYTLRLHPHKRPVYPDGTSANVPQVVVSMTAMGHKGAGLQLNVIHF